MSFKRFLGDHGGATAVEYGLIASLFVMGTIFGLNALGSSLQNLLKAVIAAVASVTSG